jgi:hypothetical protein
VINTGVISYASGALFFLVLTLVLFTGQQGRSRKNALKFASIASTVWLGFTAVTFYYGTAFFSYLVEPGTQLCVAVVPGLCAGFLGHGYASRGQPLPQGDRHRS